MSTYYFDRWEMLYDSDLCYFARYWNKDND